MANSLLTIIQIILAIPLLFILPGYVTRLLLITRQRRHTQENWFEFGFQCLLFSVILSGWIGVLLVQIGWFSIVRLLLFNTCYTLIIGSLGWHLHGTWKISPRLLPQQAWPIALLIVVAIALFFHPHEFITGGADAGVYINLGANITHTGSWLIRDPDTAKIDPALYPGIFREQPSYAATKYIQFPGFYLDDQQPGLITPQFYPLHPVWIAIFYSLAGVRFSLLTTPLWGLLGCLAVYQITRTLFGHRTGVLATSLLAITATQIWFSRYPTAEALTLYLLFSGLYAFTRYIDDQSPWMGLLAGLALGQVSLARIDVYFLLVIPACYAFYLRLGRRLEKRHLAFFAPFIVLNAHSLLFALFQSWPYFYIVHRSILYNPPIPWPLLGILGLLSLVGLLILDRWTKQHPDWPHRLAPHVRKFSTSLAIVVILAALYGYFVRPCLADTSKSWEYWYGGHDIPNVEPYNLVRLGWYITPLGIALAVLGTWQILRREDNTRTAPFLGVGLFFSFFYLYNSRNNPQHIYVMRRYVPSVIPTFIIAAAYALNTWFRQANWRRWCAIGLTIILAGWSLYAARFVIPLVERQGSIDQLESLTDILGDDNPVLLFNDDLPVSTGAIIGTPLHYLYGYSVFDLQENCLDTLALDEQIAAWQGAGRRVIVVVGSHGVENLFDSTRLTPIADFRFDVPILQVSYEHFPKETWHYAADLQIYELDAALDVREKTD